MIANRIVLLLFLLPLLQCSLMFGQEVKHAGAMRLVMTGASLENHIRWDTIGRDHLFGIGPLERLEGEVTVVDGDIYTAKVGTDGGIITSISSRAEAPFGVYAHAREFLSGRVERSVKDLQDLEKMVAGLAEESGLNMDEPFLFRVQGEFEIVKIHVLAKPADEEEHNHDLHEKAKRYFTFENTSGDLIGFYSKKHEGVFTHRGQFTHIHFIDEAKEIMGHLDDIVFSGDVIVLFSVGE